MGFGLTNINSNYPYLEEELCEKRGACGSLKYINIIRFVVMRVKMEILFEIIIYCRIVTDLYGIGNCKIKSSEHGSYSIMYSIM